MAEIPKDLEQSEGTIPLDVALIADAKLVNDVQPIIADVVVDDTDIFTYESVIAAQRQLIMDLQSQMAAAHAVIAEARDNMARVIARRITNLEAIKDRVTKGDGNG